MLNPPEPEMSEEIHGFSQKRHVRNEPARDSIDDLLTYKPYNEQERRYLERLRLYHEGFDAKDEDE